MLSSDILVSDLLAYSPRIVSLLIELRLDCVGCSLNKFCTLEEVCAQYDLDLESILCKIRDRLEVNPDSTDRHVSTLF